MDRELKQAGWLPDAKPANGNGHSNGHQRTGNGNSAPADVWACTPKRRDLTVKIVDDNRLDKNEVEQLVTDRPPGFIPTTRMPWWKHTGELLVALSVTPALSMNRLIRTQR